MNSYFSPRAEPTPLSIRVDEAEGGTVRVAAAGEIDMASAPRLGDAIAHALRHGRPDRILVDLADVTFMDSSGLNTLVVCHSEAGTLRCELRVTNPAPAVHRILDVTGLLDTFGVAAD